MHRQDGSGLILPVLLVPYRKFTENAARVVLLLASLSAPMGGT